MSRGGGGALSTTALHLLSVSFSAGTRSYVSGLLHSYGYFREQSCRFGVVRQRVVRCVFVRWEFKQRVDSIKAAVTRIGSTDNKNYIAKQRSMPEISKPQDVTSCQSVIKEIDK